MEAPDNGGAGGRRWGSGVEEAAQLPDSGVLVGLGGHARRGRSRRGDEPPARGDLAHLVAKVAVLPGSAQPVDGGGGRYVEGLQR